MRPMVQLFALLLSVGGCMNKPGDGLTDASTNAAETTEKDGSSSGDEVTGAGPSSTSTDTSSGAESTGDGTSTGGPVSVQCDDVLCAPGVLCVYPGTQCVQGEPETGGTCESIPPDNSCDMFVWPPRYCAVDPCPDDEDHLWCLAKTFCTDSCERAAGLNGGELNCYPQFCHCGAQGALP